jgi:hypothetical protein
VPEFSLNLFDFLPRITSAQEEPVIGGGLQQGGCCMAVDSS